MGTFKDRVDSASGAFAKLVNAHPVGSFRVYSLGSTVLEQRYLLVLVTDPAPVGKTNLPQPASNQLLGTHVLSFADLAPADLQETWGEPIPPYDRPAEELIMTGKSARSCAA